MNRYDVIRMAREAGFNVDPVEGVFFDCFTEELERFAALVAAAKEQEMLEQIRHIIVQAEERGAAAEREACAEKTGEFARKWWSIHCDSNKHMETTRKAHDDFCALQAAIRARGQA